MAIIQKYELNKAYKNKDKEQNNQNQKMLTF